MAAGPPDNPWIEAVISHRERGAEGIIVLDFVAADGCKLPSFSAGAHIDVEVAPGLSRQYSLCTSPAETDRYRIAILLEPASRGGSAGIHRDFTPGRRVRIGRPRNNFPLNTEAQHSVLVAGGIGITPLLAMAHHLQGQGASFELHYCSRTRSRTAFLGLLADSFESEGRLHFDDGNIEQRFDPKVDLEPPRAGVHIYICGPSGFMAWVIDSARAAGWGQEQLHLEYFTADVDATGGAFVVQTRAGRKVRVDSGRSIATALREAGIDVPLSCEQGVCGTCLVPVLAGVPDHRDVYQTDAEKAANTHVACCCSRAVSAVLVLDI
jgi:vanillate O-demethylase ferredoxin subunit